MTDHIGLVHSYYGDGKGKTTAAFGLALRCLGYGQTVVIAQFFKSRSSGEVSFIETMSNAVLLRGYPFKKFTFQMNDEERALLKTDCIQLFTKAVSEAETLNARLLVLDECLDACGNGYLPVSLVNDFLDSRPKDLEVVFTGHCMPPEIEKRSDYISKIVNEKHPFNQGIAARKTIEF